MARVFLFFGNYLQYYTSDNPQDETTSFSFRIPKSIYCVKKMLINFRYLERKGHLRIIYEQVTEILQILALYCIRVSWIEAVKNQVPGQRHQPDLEDLDDR